MALAIQPVPDPEPEVEAEAALGVPPVKAAYNLCSRKNEPKGEGEPNERTPLLRKVLYIGRTGLLHTQIIIFIYKLYMYSKLSFFLDSFTCPTVEVTFRFAWSFLCGHLV